MGGRGFLRSASPAIPLGDTQPLRRCPHPWLRHFARTSVVGASLVRFVDGAKSTMASCIKVCSGVARGIARTFRRGSGLCH